MLYNIYNNYQYIEISSQIYLKKRTHAYSRTHMNADMRAA